MGSVVCFELVRQQPPLLLFSSVISSEKFRFNRALSKRSLLSHMTGSHSPPRSRQCRTDGWSGGAGG